ncbi:Metallo-dependent phosphatase-like protein [Microdochium trichocladiopsis]|uniref:Metallo-dependent phosphatase-like protein n=1 Tax=Microdochium trichocladiopsis TaxID=1682393 RepID=A0A9P8YEV5_9PEZI|nr:Metallo-dependent phosphatase-like protein [Microdochium trichocladiopsis]KAH7037607.1 Metallo-dependent phosphatase-like protein [Microdochium trichocladiopsis]
MLGKAPLAVAVLASVTRAAQPEAPAPIAAPMRDLDWGELNFLHTTDTHGWHGGHLQESQYSADWGDYVSFADHMHRMADEKGVDLLLVDTGDRVEGNGLYDGSDPKGQFTYDIMGQQSIDAICTGNHELYLEDTVEREHDITVPMFKKSYLASNLDYIEPQSGNSIPQAQRYRTFTTKNRGYKVVALGFLFNFDRNANNSVVQPVEETVKEEWFIKAIQEKPDVFLVIGHIGLRMKEFEIIFDAIRSQNWDTPIAIFGGHAHVRDARKFDNKAYAIASGRYFETIGWMSIDGIKTGTSDVSPLKGSPAFKRRYIDNNLLGLYHHTGLNETTFPTDHGRNVTKMITKARKELKLDHRFGCAPQDYWMTRAEYPGTDSVFTLLEEQILPDIVKNKDRPKTPRIAIQNTGAIRFDIFKGPFTKDTTYLISPFTSGFSYIPDVTYTVAKRAIQMLNRGGPALAASDLKALTIPEMRHPSPFLSFSDRSLSQGLALQGQQANTFTKNFQLSKPNLVAGYTTKDDLGDDGDDAEHSPIQFFQVPNVISADIEFPKDGDPDKVDVVFNDYLQPYIIPALQFSGGDYDSDNVKRYVEGSFTDLLAAWIKENWTGKC